MSDSVHRRNSLRLGLALGAGFGIWDLIATWASPLSDDSAAALLRFYGPMFTIWTLAGFVAARRTGEMRHGASTGALVAFATFVVLDVLVIVRVNVFLDLLRNRADWQNLMARFSTSGFDSLRAYVNYRYVIGTPFKIGVVTLIGAVLGAIGGATVRVGRRRVSA